MSYSERIKLLVEIEGSQANFCAKTGLNKQTVSKIVNRGSGVNGDTISAVVEAYPDLNAEWFVTGVGEMWKTDTQTSSNTQVNGAQNDLKDEIIALQKKRIAMLEQAIVKGAPHLMGQLGLE